jgi:hypothetical protein
MDTSPPARSPARTLIDPGLSRAYSDRFIPSRTRSNLASYLNELDENAPCAHSAEREARDACPFGARRAARAR